MKTRPTETLHHQASSPAPFSSFEPLNWDAFFTASYSNVGNHGLQDTIANLTRALKRKAESSDKSPSKLRIVELFNPQKKSNRMRQCYDENQNYCVMYVPSILQGPQCCTCCKEYKSDCHRTEQIQPSRCCDPQIVYGSCGLPPHPKIPVPRPQTPPYTPTPARSQESSIIVSDIPSPPEPVLEFGVKERTFKQRKPPRQEWKWNPKPCVTCMKKQNARTGDDCAKPLAALTQTIAPEGTEVGQNTEASNEKRLRDAASMKKEYRPQYCDASVDVSYVEEPHMKKSRKKRKKTCKPCCHPLCCCPASCTRSCALPEYSQHNTCGYTDTGIMPSEYYDQYNSNGDTDVTDEILKGLQEILQNPTNFGFYDLNENQFNVTKTQKSCRTLSKRSRKRKASVCMDWASML